MTKAYSNDRNTGQYKMCIYWNTLFLLKRWNVLIYDEWIGTSMVNMYSKYRLQLLLLWRGKNGGQRVSVDVHYRILSDIDDGSPDMDTCVSIQKAED